MSADPAPAPSSPFLTWSRAHREFCAVPCDYTWLRAANTYHGYLSSLGPGAECWLAPYLAQLSIKE